MDKKLLKVLLIIVKQGIKKIGSLNWFMSYLYINCQESKRNMDFQMKFQFAK